MVKQAFVFVLFSGIVLPLSLFAQESLVKFDGGIGSIPLRAGGLPNDARGVNPGGRPWVIERLGAEVKRDGRISVDGRGLLLGGGDNIGRTGGQSVHARLFCGTVAHNSETVALDPDGDFRIDGVLTPVPPETCDNAALLIVSGASGGPGNWFAAGIPKL